MRESHKHAAAAAKEALDAELRLKNLEEANKVVIEEDKSLPASLRIKIREAPNNIGKRVQIFGWVHRLRRQGNQAKCFSYSEYFYYT